MLYSSCTWDTPRMFWGKYNYNQETYNLVSQGVDSGIINSYECQARIAETIVCRTEMWDRRGGWHTGHWQVRERWCSSFKEATGPWREPGNDGSPGGRRKLWFANVFQRDDYIMKSKELLYCFSFVTLVRVPLLEQTRGLPLIMLCCEWKGEIV